MVTMAAYPSLEHSRAWIQRDAFDFVTVRNSSSLAARSTGNTMESILPRPGFVADNHK